MKLIMMVGIPGSGKSVLAEKVAKTENALIVSTDEIRRELFGDASRQKKNTLVFQHVHERMNACYEKGQNVLLDATNITRERRIGILEHAPDAEKICYYMDVPFALCLQRNTLRKRKVEREIMDKIYKNLEMPVIGEGWHEIRVVHEPLLYALTKEDFLRVVTEAKNQKEVFDGLSKLDFFREMMEFEQQNPHHRYTLDTHTYLVYDYLDMTVSEEEKILMKTVALFHDVGKLYTQIFKKNRSYANYFGHENVSAQIAFHFLTEMGFKREFIDEVVSLVQFHMKITHGGDKGAQEIYHRLGEDALAKLYQFSEADLAAK